MASLAFLFMFMKKKATPLGEDIEIHIDSEDLVNIFEGVMSSELLQKVARDLVQRNSKNHTLKNLHHHEDELLLNKFGIGVVKKKEYGEPTTMSSKLNGSIDFLEKLNEQFNENYVESDDFLTDASEDMKPTYQLIERHELKNVPSMSVANSTAKSIANSTANSTEHLILEHENINFQKNETKSGRAKKIYGSDRLYFRQV